MTTLADDVPDPEPVPALGRVLDEDRGSLPYALIHGEALVACAAWALGDAGVTPLDVGVPWDDVLAAGEPLVLHDALCPMTPADFIASCVRRSLAAGAVVAGVRPVTDTVKVVDGETVGRTVDRTGLLAVTSPVVLPPTVLGGLPGGPGSDLAALVARLVADGVEVDLVEAPAAGRRVGTEDDLRVLEALTTR